MSSPAALTKIISGLVFLLSVSGGIAPAAVNRLPDDVRAALQKEHDFTTIKKVSQIPPAGLAAFHAGQDGHDNKMADPGGKFQVGAAVADKSLPGRQLEFAALSKDYLLIHYAWGGNGLGYYSVLLKKSGDAFAVIWVGEGEKLKSFHRFVKALKTDQVDDRAGYVY